MDETEVVYTAVQFTKSAQGKITGSASLPGDTTNSDIRVTKDEPSKKLPGSQQNTVSNGGSKLTSERVAMAFLSVLLAAAVAALVFTSYKNIKSMEHLQQLTVMNKNLTERWSEVKPCNKVDKICPQFPNLPLDGSCPKCQKGWEQHGTDCYHFSSKRLTWENATKYCLREGGCLVRIDSDMEQTFLVDKLKDIMDNAEDRFWIGLTDSKEEGTWFWADGSPLNTSLAFWDHKQPDNWKIENTKGENCVRMGAKKYYKNCWADKSCSIPHKSICEKPTLDWSEVCRKCSSA